MGSEAVYIEREQKQERSWRKTKLVTDRSLVEKFHAGDDHAFANIYVRYRNIVFAIALGVLRSKDDAEDVMQEVFATAAKYLSTSTPDNLKAWFARVTRNSAIDHLRARKQTVEMNESHERTSREEPHHLLERQNAVKDVVRYLSVLPEAQRTALLLRELTGGSYVEISQTLGMDPETVGNLIKRARVALRAQRSGENLGCPVVRDQLAAELDRRKLSTELRFHIRACSGCRDFDRGLRSDRKAIRALLPMLPLMPISDNAYGMGASEPRIGSAHAIQEGGDARHASTNRVGLLLTAATIVGLLSAANLNDGIGTAFDVKYRAELIAVGHPAESSAAMNSDRRLSSAGKSNGVVPGQTSKQEQLRSATSPHRTTPLMTGSDSSNSTVSPNQTPPSDFSRRDQDSSSRSVTEASASTPTESSSKSHVGSQSTSDTQSKNTQHSSVLDGSQETPSSDHETHGGLVPNYKPSGLSPGNTGPPSGTSGSPTGTPYETSEKPSGAVTQPPSGTSGGSPQTTPEPTEQKPSGDTTTSKTTKTTSGTQSGTTT